MSLTSFSSYQLSLSRALNHLALQSRAEKLAQIFEYIQTIRESLNTMDHATNSLAEFLRDAFAWTKSDLPCGFLETERNGLLITAMAIVETSNFWCFYPVGTYFHTYQFLVHFLVICCRRKGNKNDGAGERNWISITRKRKGKHIDSRNHMFSEYPSHYLIISNPITNIKIDSKYRI